ncbi:mitochondrial transcription rescue factor 1 [Neosynchiropus ocellatus]
MTHLARLLAVSQRPLLAAGRCPGPPRWAPGTVCARQLWGRAGVPAAHRLGSKRSAAGTAADAEPSVPEGYKDVERRVQSLRFDVVMKAGLDLARNKIEDGLYAGRLRLNGRRLLKKSKKVKVGDTLDLVALEDEDAGTVRLKRVVLREILWASPEEDKFEVSLRRWKVLELRREEGSKLDS